MDPTFTMHLWCRLTTLETTTINLLIPASINNCISAQEILNRFFYYKRTPLAPPVARVVVHDMLSKQATWEPHEKKMWYLDSAPDQYMYHKNIYQGNIN